MKMLYVVCNDFQEMDECVCCVCGSKEKAESKIAEYKKNFEQYEYPIPTFWIKKIPSEMSENDCFEFD